MADSFQFILDYLRDNNFERAEKALRIELDARRAPGVNSTNEHECAHEFRDLIDESRIDHFKALSLQLNPAPEKVQVSKNGMTGGDECEGYESDGNYASEWMKSGEKQDCQMMVGKMKATKEDFISEPDIFDNSAFCSQSNKKLEVIGLHQEFPTMSMEKWQISLQWGHKDNNCCQRRTTQKTEGKECAVKPSQSYGNHLQARYDEAKDDDWKIFARNHSSLNSDWMDFGISFNGVLESSESSHSHLPSSTIDKESGMELEHQEEDPEFDDCLDYLKENRTSRVDGFVNYSSILWELDLPNNIKDADIFNERQAEDFPSVSPARDMLENKMLCLNKENHERSDYETLLCGRNQECTTALFKQDFGLGSFLDISMRNLSGQEKYESGINGFPGDQNIGETPELLSGFATLGNEQNASGSGYPKGYWDSDTYDNNEDPGYHRQPIEGEAWFLAHEIEYPSDEDDVADTRKKSMIYPLQNEINTISGGQTQFISEQEHHLFTQAEQKQSELVSVHHDANFNILRINSGHLCLNTHEHNGSKVHEHGFSFSSPSSVNIPLTQDIDNYNVRGSRLDGNISWRQESKESSSISSSKHSLCLNVASVPFKASAELDNKSFLTRDEIMGTDAYSKDAIMVTRMDGRDASVLQEELEQMKLERDEFEIFSLRIVHRKNRTGFEEDKDFSILPNSVVAGRYLVTEYLGSAAFSKAVQARDLQTGIDVCMKIVKNNKDFFDQSLDEIKLLKYINRHDPADNCHILRLYDYFYYCEHLFLVCELLRANLYEFQKFNRESGGESYFTLPRLQSITLQCLEAMEFLHGLGLIHCDLKPENILIKSYNRCEIKVIDVGSSCFQTDNLCSYVQSRSYRAPEVILGLPYDQKIDIWSLGCILAELCSGNVLFQNDSLATMLARVTGIIGPIPPDMISKGREAHKYFTKNFMIYEKNQVTNRLEFVIPKNTSLRYRLPMGDQGFVDFVGYLLQIHPENRPSAAEALKHPWLTYPYNAIST